MEHHPSTYVHHGTEGGCPPLRGSSDQGGPSHRGTEGTSQEGLVERPMRVVTVVDGDMELGRGPLSRLHAILPELADRCEIHLALLSPPGPELLGPLSRLGLTYREFPVIMEGWRMLNAENRAEEISSWALDLR